MRERSGPESSARPPGGRAGLLSHERPKWRARLQLCHPRGNMATVIWFFDQVHVPMELRFDEFAVIPLSAKDGALHKAARSFAASFGREFTFASWQTPIVDMVAIVQKGVRAAAIEEALSATAPRAMAVASALVYSQFGRGRPLGAKQADA